MINVYEMILQRIHIDESAFEQVLRTVGDEILKAGARIGKARTSGPEDYADSVIDEECDLVENLLGLAYVLCQVSITRVVSDVRRLHDRVKQETPARCLTTTSGKRAAIMKFSSGASREPAPVEVLDALANYFKHESEWRSCDWSKLQPGKGKETASIIQAAGASPGSNGNLRSVFAHLLGHHDYERAFELAKPVIAWKASLLEAYRQELKSLGLI